MRNKGEEKGVAGRRERNAMVIFLLCFLPKKFTISSLPQIIG